MSAVITITKLDFEGRERLTYQGQRVFANEQTTVVRCRWEAPKPFAVGAFVLQAGDLFIEHYYPDEPFNIMAVYSPQGELKGHYCNITAPAEIAAASIRWRDWLLDLLVLPDGGAIELDRDELDALPARHRLRVDAEQGMHRLRAWLATHHWPLDKASVAL